MNHYLRKRSKSVLVAMLLFLCSLGAIAQAQYKNGVQRGLIKVKFTPTMSTSLSQMPVSARSGQLTTGMAAFDAVAKQTKASSMYRLFPYDAKNETKLQKHGLHLWYVVEIDETMDPKVVASQFKRLGEVSIAEVENQKLLSPYVAKPYTATAGTSATLPFNDPLLKDQWHYDNQGQTGFGDADVNLFAAWTKTTGNKNIIVSIHDEGVDVNHKDLRENIWVNKAEADGVSGVDDDRNGYIDDINGFNFQKNRGALDPEFHGTHVAGTVAAVTNNGIGVSGVAGGSGNGDGVKVMSLQIFGGLFENSYVYAANNGAVISQNSWGYTQPFAFDQSIKDAITYFIAEAGNYTGSPMKGGIVIFAAGNSNYDSEWYPGYFSNVLSVSSLGPEWKKAGYSNFGTWIEIAAPGGDIDNYGARNGVLSTSPKDNYAYLQGTSMACPHVSGIAALALANRNKQLTNTELWTKLVTGVVNIDAFNEEYIGKLGTGAIDAAMAIQNDLGIAPTAISTLSIKGLAQEFATLDWIVPTDTDDGKPSSYQLYVHTQPITVSNLGNSRKINIVNTKAAGETVEYEVNQLLGLTTYYFALTSTDRWGNVSLLSNIESGTTNSGPSIAVDENSQAIDLSIDVASSAIGDHDITIFNNAEGVLRWNHFMRTKNATAAFNASKLNYPKMASKKQGGVPAISMRSSVNSQNLLRYSATPTSSTAFTPINKSYTLYPTNIIGEEDLTLTNSAAAKFFVTEDAGFNLTNVSMYLKHDPAKGPVIVEVYKNELRKENLVLAQEYSNYDQNEVNANITFEEQLLFDKGENFWIVFHFPAGNRYPIGIGFEQETINSTYCFLSFNLGATWVPLEEAINDRNFALAITASSQNATLGTYITLNPGSGDVVGNSNTTTTLTADVGTLVNGSYNASVILSSNDATNPELRIPVSLQVSGQKPSIKHVLVADFGSVFVGTSKTLDIALTNEGYGNFNSPQFSITNSAFVISNTPWQIKARSESIVSVSVNPTVAGNINDVLTITDGENTYEIMLFAVGAETAKITVTPPAQTINNIVLGAEVTANIVVENTGAFPLKYFIPGFDTKAISTNWPSEYHSYGYAKRSNRVGEANPITYGFQNIKTTGIDITSELNTNFEYFEVDMGFDFPYYDKKFQKLYIAKQGFTVFDNSVNPLNLPRLKDLYGPRGYISILGTFTDLISQGKILYKVEADRVIVQYDNIWDGFSVGESITAQMVLFYNGDIRFYYDTMDYSETNQQYLTILMEDVDKKDGILLNTFGTSIDLYSGLAIGFDYPGPNNITSIVNGSGVVAPGSSANLTIKMSTADLAEGTINRYLNIISNVPSQQQTTPLIQLNITSGGTAIPNLSTSAINFGDVFQGATKSATFTIKNTGTADVRITSITSAGRFTLTGDRPTNIPAGLYKLYKVTVPTGTLRTITDVLRINYSNGTHQTVQVDAKVVPAPNVVANLTLLQQTLAYGSTTSVPYSIQNTGAGKLEVVTSGNEWVSFTAPSTTPDDITYLYEQHNTGGVYQWLEIRKTGTQLPFVDFTDFENTYWNDLTLPFPIEFYGESYNKFKIGYNGLISFEEENPNTDIFTDVIPTQRFDGPCIMPYWTFSTFSDYYYPVEDIGAFYQFFSDKIVITWSYFVNNAGGMGDPVSAQVIFYKNGAIKFQYKREEGGMDLTTRMGTIGLQKNATTGIMISEYNNVDHGQGLAYILTPAKKLSVPANTTLNGTLNFDSRFVYGGVYNHNFKIQTNVPNKENLVKPLRLTVTGAAQLVATPNPVDFGSNVITQDQFGNPTVKAVPINFSNTGAAKYDITWAQMADGSQGFGLQLLTQGFFGPEWTDISNIYSPWAWQTPTYSVQPGDVVSARATFAPSMAGTLSDELVLTTSIGEKRIPMTGLAVEPPVISVDQTPISVSMIQPSETSTGSIEFNNIEGKSPLTYSLSIEFERKAATTVANEVLASAGTTAATTLQAFGATNTNAITPTASATYNRELKHSDKLIPDTFIGNGGTEKMTIATRFNSGDNGFNVSHVETYMRAESLTSGEIVVEIRGGGTSIATTSILATGKISFTSGGNDEVGKWYTIKLEKPVGLYPNEDFYVVVTYPFGIPYAQGSITDSPRITNRYLYLNEGTWFDIQNFNGFGSTGWLMKAAEETSAVTTWLNITSTKTGELNVGDDGTVSLAMSGSIAQRGEQHANVVFTSNDPINPVVKVPVKLRLNDAPVFMNVPENMFIAEGETETLAIPVVDMEGNTFTVAAVQTYPGMVSSFLNGTLTITLTPGYNDAGTKKYAFRATDQYNIMREMILTVEVINANQAPGFIGQHDLFTFNKATNMVEYEIEDLFSDPDGDSFDYSVTAEGDHISVFTSGNKFIVKTDDFGNGNLIFTVTDNKGAEKTETLPVKVDLVAGLEDKDVNFSIYAYPNPTSGQIEIHVSGEISTHYSIDVINTFGTAVMPRKNSTNERKTSIDLSSLPTGIYLIQVSDEKGKSTRRIVKE